MVTSPLYNKEIGAQPLSYYTAAINYFEKKVTGSEFFVFSDDLQWCKDNLSSIYPIHFVGEELAGNSGIGHFYLMKECKYFIISNSTFAWWAAWLGEHSKKMVIYPLKWYKEPRLNNKEMCPINWIKL